MDRADERTRSDRDLVQGDLGEDSEQEEGWTTSAEDTKQKVLEVVQDIEKRLEIIEEVLQPLRDEVLVAQTLLDGEGVSDQVLDATWRKLCRARAKTLFDLNAAATDVLREARRAGLLEGWQPPPVRFTLTRRRPGPEEEQAEAEQDPPAARER